jgi:hypothetical protein
MKGKQHNVGIMKKGISSMSIKRFRRRGNDDNKIETGK